MRILLFSLICTLLCGVETLHLRHAATAEERLQGLMGVKELPENEGMIFHFTTSGIHPFWGWGCFLDLGIAYLDAEGYVLEIAHLETYPTDEKPTFSNALTRLWMEKAYTPETESTHVLEMQWDWFDFVDLRHGDRILFSLNSPEAILLKKE